MSANRTVIRLDRSPPAWSRLAAIALLLFALAGCRSTSPAAHLNPIDPSFALPPAKTLEYPGPERFWNTAGLVISPARIVAQVGSEVPMFAGICDGKGQLLPHEKIEWMLDNGGVGSFVSVSDPIRPICLELVSSRARKIDNTYAETETSPANVILTRGTTNINDDMVMPRGYTWVTVTSPVEGSSYVTAYGPDVYSWDVRRKSARIVWIDAEWSFPEAVCLTPGAPATLTTCVMRRTTKAPLADWIVKYAITGGAAAGFGTDNAQSVEIATNDEGRASVELIPAADAPGTTCISVELIRSECATPNSPERVSIATAATQVTWGTPEPPAPPPSVPVIPSPPVVPPSTPPPITPPAVTPPPTVPPAIPPAAATPPPPAAPRVDLVINGPETAELGRDITYTVEVINQGATAATDLVLVARFDDGLQHPKSRSPIQSDFGTLEPGQTRSVNLNFRVMKPGKQCFTIEVSDIRNLGRAAPFVSEQQCVTAPEQEQPPPQAALTVNVTGPEAAVVGDEVRFTIEVKNIGDVPAQGVRITAELDQSFDPNSIGVPSDNMAGAARSPSGSVVWTVDSIPAKGRVTRVIGGRGKTAAQRACCFVKVTDASKQPIAQEKCLQMQPAPVAAPGPLKVEVHDYTDPVKANGTVAYQVKITNIGQAPERQVRLTLVLPAEMTLVGTPRANVREESRDGRTIRFAPIAELRQGEPINFDLVLRADRPGQATLRAEVTSNNVTTPIVAMATTTIGPP